MQIVDEFGMEIGGGLVVRTPSGFAPKYSSGCPLGFRAMVATANETQQPYSVNRNTSQRLPSQRKRNSSLVHLESGKVPPSILTNSFLLFLQNHRSLLDGKQMALPEARLPLSASSSPSPRAVH